MQKLEVDVNNLFHYQFSVFWIIIFYNLKSPILRAWLLVYVLAKIIT